MEGSPEITHHSPCILLFLCSGSTYMDIDENGPEDAEVNQG